MMATLAFNELIKLSFLVAQNVYLISLRNEKKNMKKFNFSYTSQYQDAEKVMCPNMP